MHSRTGAEGRGNSIERQVCTRVCGRRPRLPGFDPRRAGTAPVMTWTPSRRIRGPGIRRPETARPLRPAGLCDSRHLPCIRSRCPLPGPRLPWRQTRDVFRPGPVRVWRCPLIHTLPPLSPSNRRQAIGHPERIPARKLSISRRRLSACWASSRAAPSTCVAAAPVSPEPCWTPAMLPDTLWVPVAAS